MLRQGGNTVAADVALPVVVMVVVAVFAILMKMDRMREALVVFVIGAVAATTLVDGLWAPTLKPMPPERIAAAIRERFGDRRCWFYGTPTVPLVFALRQVVPAMATAQDLAALAAREPRAVILVPDENVNQPTVLPGILIERDAFKGSDKTIRVCELKPSPETTQSSR